MTDVDAYFPTVIGTNSRCAGAVRVTPLGLHESTC